MNLKKIIRNTLGAVTLCSLLSSSAEAENWKSKDAQIAASNALLCGAAAGIKTKSWKGFWKGALSGSVIYAGKRIRAENNVPWVGHAVTGLGSSMFYNTMTDQGLFDNYYLVLGFTELGYEKENGFQAKVLPETIIAGAVLWLNDDYTFDLKQSLRQGNFYFTKQDSESDADGFAMFQSMVLNTATIQTPARLKQVEGHEAVHLAQYPALKGLAELMPQKRKVTLFEEKIKFFEMDYLFTSIPFDISFLLVPYQYRPNEIEARILVREIFKEYAPEPPK